MKDDIEQVSDMMKKSIYKKDAVLLIFIFPILCMIILGGSIAEVIINSL